MCIRLQLLLLAVYVNFVNGIADVGTPLFLTPLINQGKIDEAKTKSATNILNISGHSGFITVNDTFNSNMFFWYFPSKNGNKSVPLLIWLQGGPGADSTFGLFVENGPYTVDNDFNVHLRSITWMSEYNAVYIDNPVGAGLSFTENELGYANNEVDVGQNLYNFLLQFYQLFNELQSVDLYISGESYAGKYIPALGYKIHIENAVGANFKIPLAGLIIGDGHCDPESMWPAYANLLYNAGLVDENERDHFDSAFKEGVEMIRSKNFKGAFQIFTTMLLTTTLNPYPTYFFNVTGGHNYHFYTQSEESPEYEYYVNYLEKPEIRQAIHVGNISRNAPNKVQQHLAEDVPDTVKPWIIEMLNSGKYSMLFYNGQFDISLGHPVTERFLWNLEWSGLGDYKVAKRQIWKLNLNDTEVAGYVRKSGKLTQALIRGAGHMVPYDQPERIFSLIKQFTQD